MAVAEPSEKRILNKRIDFSLRVEDIPFSRKLIKIRGRVTRRLSELKIKIKKSIPHPSIVGPPSLIVYVSSATHILLLFWIGWSWIVLNPSPVEYYTRLLTLLCGVLMFWVSSHIILKSFAGSRGVQ